MEEEKTPKGLSKYSLNALKKLLDDVLMEEDYEKAAVIRDEINKRSGGKDVPN